MEITSYPFTPILGWSVSRYDNFSTCKRRYYYDYYNKYDREFGKAKIMKLRNMTSIPLEKGNITHDILKVLLERLIKTTQPLDNERFAKHVEDMSKSYCDSKIFAEIYYKEIEEIPLEEMINQIKRMLDNFLDSERYAWIVEEAIKKKEDWIIEPGGYGETRIDNMKAYCKVDFLFPVQEDIYILDWKTGKADPTKHRKQMIGYSLWAKNQFNCSYDNILPFVVYLNPEYSESSLKLSKEEIDTFSQRVKEETEEMYRYCSNINENIPIAKEEFNLTENQRLCSFCNYRELCGRG